MDRYELMVNEAYARKRANTLGLSRFALIVSIAAVVATIIAIVLDSGPWLSGGLSMVLTVVFILLERKRRYVRELRRLSA